MLRQRRVAVRPLSPLASAREWTLIRPLYHPSTTSRARELQVLRLAAEGSTNSTIGRKLGLSVHAVKFHLASVYRKLGVDNRTQAAAAFLSAGARLAPQKDVS